MHTLDDPPPTITAPSPRSLRRHQAATRWSARVLLTLASLVLSLALLELLLHAAGYPTTKTGHQRFFVEYDPQRGWRNVPGADGFFVTDEYRVHLQYNSRGIRGPEHAYAKPAGTYRVLLLGDSFIEGYSVAREERVSEVLEKLLATDDPTRRYEVIALGTAGYSTDQELLWLESEGVKYEPDLVVDMFYMNDVWFNGQTRYWRGEKPAFVLANGALVPTNVPVPAPPKRAARGAGDAHGAKHWVRAHSKLVALAALALESSTQLRTASAAAGLVAPRAAAATEQAETRGVADELSVFAREPSAATRRAWEVTDALLGAMADVAGAAGARFLAFHIPFKGAVYEADWQRMTAALGLPLAALDSALVGDRFAAACAAHRLECIEPTAEFRATAAAGGERLYYPRDNHWAPPGHALAAEILARRVHAIARIGGSES